MTQLSQCTHLEHSPNAKPVVFHWDSCSQFSTKMGTEEARVTEQVEQMRRKGTVPGHNSETQRDQQVSHETTPGGLHPALGALA